MRPTLGIALGTAALAVPPLLLAQTQQAGESAAAPARDLDTRPNIVFITTDDMRADDLVAMPNVRRLLTTPGTTFRRSYAPFPLCCPARASWVTGQYNHNNGVMGNGDPVGGYAALDPSSTVATWLADAGYQTAFVGKYLNGYGLERPVTVPPGWQEWHTSVAGGDYFLTRLRETDGTSPLTVTVYDGPYQADLYDDIAVEIIARRVPAAAPLFLWVSQFPPHSGRPAEPDDPGVSTPAVPPRYKDLYAGTPLPKGPAYNEADVSDKPAYVRNRPPISPATEAGLTESYQQRLESLRAVDDSVGHIVNALIAQQELNKTVIVFTSDNGYMFGEHRIHAGKTVPYEPSARVPLVIRGPGFPAGTSFSQRVANIDIAPTFADLANTAPGLDVDGRSLLPLVDDPASWPPRPLVLEAGPTTVDGPDLYHGVLAGRFKYLEHYTGEVEFYDLASDPHELQSLTAIPAYDDEQAWLAQVLRQMENCAGAACQ